MFKAETKDHHADAADFHDDIRAGGQIRDIDTPLLEDRTSLPGVGPGAENAAEVIEHKGAFRHGTRERGEFGNLAVIQPRVEGEPERAKPLYAAAKGVGGHEVVGWFGVCAANLFAWVECRCVANPAKAAPPGSDVCFEYIVHLVAKRHVGEAHDALDLCTVANTQIGDVGNRLGFTHWSHSIGSIGAITPRAFHVHSALDVVSGTGICLQVGEQISAHSIAIPQVMMRIDDGDLREQGSLRASRQPLVVPDVHASDVSRSIFMQSHMSAPIRCGLTFYAAVVDDLTAAGFRAGEPDAVRAVYHAYGRQVFMVAQRVLGNRSLAEEATQQCFVQAWRASATFEPGREFAPWLATIARRVAIDIHRREARRPTSQLDDASELHAALISMQPSADEISDAWAVRAAIDALPSAEREIVRLQHLGQLTHPEIAQQLQIPLGTVKSRSYRAHRMLAAMLGHLRDESATRPQPGPHPNHEQLVGVHTNETTER